MSSKGPFRLFSRLRAIVLEGELPDQRGPLHTATAVFRALVLAGLRFERDLGRERAAGLAYSSLLALIPVFLLGVAAMGLLSAQNPDAATDLILNLVVPGEASDLKDSLKEFFQGAQHSFEGDSGGSRLGQSLLGFGMLIYFVAGLMTGVDRTVGAIWGTGSYRALLGRLSAYWAVITLGPILLALSFAGTALAGDLLGEDAGAFLSTLLPFGVTWLSVFLFYQLMPHTKVRVRAALAGAVVAGSLWEGSKLLMGWYLSQPKTILAVAGFFPAALLWMYVSWLIAIYGLEVAYVVHHGAWQPGRRVTDSPRLGHARDGVTLGVAVVVAQCFDEGEFPDRPGIADRLGVPEDEVDRALAVLDGAGLVAAHPDGGYRPARGPDGIRAVDVVGASRGPVPRTCGLHTPAAARVAATFIRDLSERGATGVADVSLADLVRRLPGSSTDRNG